MGQLWSRAVGGQEDNNQSPIAVAIRENNSQEVGRLLQEGVIEEQEEPLLCLAARLGHKECVMELLNFGSRESANISLDLNQEDKSGFSPLVLAVYGGHTDVVVALIKSGVDVNKRCTSGTTAFNVALITGKIDIAEALMKQLDFDTKRLMEPCMSSGSGLHENQYKDEYPLLMYCRRLNLPAVKMLVRGGHVLDVVDAEGRGALWYASLPNRRRLGRNFNGGFDVLIRRVRGDHEPELRGELVKLLVNSGVKVNQGVLDNLNTSLPSLRAEAENWMRTPPSLLTCARSALWAAVRNGGVRNARCGVENLIEEHLPSSLSEFILFESVS